MCSVRADGGNSSGLVASGLSRPHDEDRMV